MRALRQARPDIRFSGVGGRHMEGEGLVSPFSIEELSIIGITAIARRLPQILRRIRETADAAVAARPDALVIIDSPDFTHRVARKVRATAPDIRILNYAPPSVWAWRPWRGVAAHLFWAYYHVVKRREGISLQAKKPTAKKPTAKTKRTKTTGRTKKNG